MCVLACAQVAPLSAQHGGLGALTELMQVRYGGLRARPHT